LVERISALDQTRTDSQKLFLNEEEAEFILDNGEPGAFLSQVNEFLHNLRKLEAKTT